jgi:hypothetical protein
MSHHPTRPPRSAYRRLGAVWIALLAALPAAAQPAGPGLRGILGARAAGNPPEIAEAFVRANRAALGLEAADLDDWRLSDRTVTRRTGVTHLHYRQRLAGIEVRGGDLAVSVLPDGRLVGLRHRFVRDLARVVRARAPALTARQAVQAAADHLGLALRAPLETRELRGGPAREVLLGGGGISVDPIPVKLVYWPDGAGAARLAWNLFVRPAGGQHWWNLDVDAATGELLAQTDWILNDGYRVFPLPLEDPDDGPRSLASGPAAASASPFGWHDTNGAPRRGEQHRQQRRRPGGRHGNDGSGCGRAAGRARLRLPARLRPAASPGRRPPPRTSTGTTLMTSTTPISTRRAETPGEQLRNGGVGGDPVLADAWTAGAEQREFQPRPRAPRMQMFLWSFWVRSARRRPGE